MFDKRKELGKYTCKYMWANLIEAFELKC